MFSNKKAEEMHRLMCAMFEHFITDLDNLMTNYFANGHEAAGKPKYDEEFERLKLKSGNSKEVSWNDLYDIELLISNLLPLARLSRHVWQLRQRYRDVVGLSQYEAYLSSKPPELAPSKVDAPDYRADIEYLLTEIYVRYTLTPYNEELRDDISKKVSTMIIAGLGIIIIAACAFYIFSGNTDVLEQSLGTFNLVLVLFIGAMGGLCSMQQRYQSTPRDGDPVDNVLLLQQSWSRLFMPAISGAIFAALLYFIIIGGLVSGQLFPSIYASAPGREGKNMLLAIRTNRPDTVGDYAKLVIWAFLAGFAERLVPDTLARFMATKEVGVKSTK